MKQFLFASLCLLFMHAAISQPAAYDNSFGTAGKVLTNFNYDNYAADYSTALQPDGKIIMGGEIQVPGKSFCVARLFASGKIDSSFGDNGKIIFNDLPFPAKSVAIQSDGKIIAMGNSNTAVVCVRLNPDGSTDNSYNSNGRVILTVPGTLPYVNQIKLQQDGKLVLAGYAYGDFGKDFFIARILNTGVLDASFNGGGNLLIPVCNHDDQANGISFQAGGKIIITGYAQFTVYNNDLVALRLNTNGTIDNTFNNTGIFKYAGIYQDFGQDIAVQTDNKIILAGGSNGAYLVIRLNADGTIDNSFNGNGAITVSVGNTNVITNIFIRSSGKIAFTGASYVSASQDGDFSACQLTTDGALDPAFNGTGKMYFPLSNGVDYCMGSAIQADDKLLLTGFSSVYPLFSVSRVNPNGTLDASFGIGGILRVEMNASDESVTGLIIQPDNKIITAGQKSSGYLYKGVPVVRYLNNGTADNSFGQNGKLLVPISDFTLKSFLLNPDGKFLLAGNFSPPYPQFSSVGVARINSNGTIDSSFNGSGIFKVPADGGNNFASAGIRLPDGSLVIVGSAVVDNPVTWKVFVAKVTGTGHMDSSFGSNGKVTLDLNANNHNASLNAIAVQGDGKIVIAGSIVDNIPDTSEVLVLRLNPDGSVDNTFAVNGIKRMQAVPAGYSEGTTLAILPDGKIIIGGDEFTDDSSFVTLMRLNSDGSFDNTFNGNGILYASANEYRISNDMVSDSTGRIYLAGSSEDENTHITKMFLARVTASGRFDSSLSPEPHGVLETGFNSSEAQVNKMSFRPDGSLVLAGNAFNPGTLNSSDFALVSVLPGISAGPGELCPGGSTMLSSNIAGGAYQWQVNTGAGFADIPDNSIYSGTHSQSLLLSIVPSSYYGYQYRCMVAGANSNVFTLKFLNTWVGSVNNAWENPANWSCGSVPDINTDVKINSGSVVLSSNAAVRTLTIAAGASFTVSSGFILTIMH